MIINDRVYGKPLVLYIDTKANIQALLGLGEGSVAYATDSDEFGSYDGSSWTWGQAGGAGQYRQFVYEVSSGTFTFVADEDGEPVMALEDLE